MLVIPCTRSAALSSVSIAMSHASAGIKVSALEAKRLDTESTAQLLTQQRLALIIDLDQTIIHATVDPTVGEWIQDADNPNYGALSNVGRFKLGMDGKSVLDVETHDQIREKAGSDAEDEENDGCWYYVKPRPGLEPFLQALTKKYELHVYTMGTRSYADCVCKLVDPAGTLFGSRILSRDESGSLVQKSLSRLFPVDTSMVVIIDDRSDVWSRSPNLIKVNPYDFFVGIGDINATFLPAAPTPEDEVEIGADAAPAEATTGKAAAAATDESSAAAVAHEEKAQVQQQAVLTEQMDSRPLAKMQEAKLQEAAVEHEHEHEEETEEAATAAHEIEFAQQQAVLRDEDDELIRVQAILDTIHEQWYKSWRDMYGEKLEEDPKKLADCAKPTVTTIIGGLKEKVLAGCKLVFSGVIPLGERPQE